MSVSLNEACHPDRPFIECLMAVCKGRYKDKDGEPAGQFKKPTPGTHDAERVERATRWIEKFGEGHKKIVTSPVQDFNRASTFKMIEKTTGKTGFTAHNAGDLNPFLSKTRIEFAWDLIEQHPDICMPPPIPAKRPKFKVLPFRAPKPVKYEMKLKPIAKPVPVPASWLPNFDIDWGQFGEKLALTAIVCAAAALFRNPEAGSQIAASAAGFLGFNPITFSGNDSTDYPSMSDIEAKLLRAHTGRLPRQ